MRNLGIKSTCAGTINSICRVEVLSDSFLFKVTSWNSPKLLTDTPTNQILSLFICNVTLELIGHILECNVIVFPCCSGVKL